MATSTDVRDWARADGYTVSSRGRVAGPLIDRWNHAHPDDPYVPEDRGPAAPAPDYPDDEFEAAFATIPDDGDTGETRPARPPAAKSTARVRDRLFGGKPKGKAKRKPRVSTEELLATCWRGLAGMARPLPPLHRTLRMQAPVAGTILEDAVRDTIVDPFLQPLARLAGTGKAAAALIGPPLFVTAMTVHGQQQAELGQSPNPLFWSVAQEGLRSSLMAWLDIAGPKFEEAMKREKEFESKYGQSVDEMIAWLFSAPADDQTEEANIRRAQGLRDDDHPGM